MEIRKALVTDVNEIEKIRVASWHEAYKDILPKSFLQKFTLDKRIKIFQKEIEIGKTLIVEEKKNILGFLTIKRSNENDITFEASEISGLYIKPEYWKNGIGKYLLTEAEKEIETINRQLIIIYILKENIRARLFYEKMRYAYDNITTNISGLKWVIAVFLPPKC